MFTELYLPSKTLSTCLALIGALHQVISCSGDDTAQALEELLYFFTRVGIL